MEGAGPFASPRDTTCVTRNNPRLGSRTSPRSPLPRHPISLLRPTLPARPLRNSSSTLHVGQPVAGTALTLFQKAPRETDQAAAVEEKEEACLSRAESCRRPRDAAGWERQRLRARAAAAAPPLPGTGEAEALGPPTPLCLL